MSSQFSDGKIPGMDAMNDTLSFVKNLWGGMQVPGMVAPTISIDDLDKKIKDLKTVESWLTVNMNMLRGTIQALEVQRATVSALNSLGAAFAENVAKHTEATSNKPSAPSDTASTMHGWPMPETPAAAKAQTKPEPEPEPEIEEQEEVEEEVPAASTKSEPSANSTDNQFGNPAAWWTLLQGQFKQAVSEAMAGEVPIPAEVKPAKTSAKTPSARKPSVVKKAAVTAKPKAKAVTSKPKSTKAVAKTSTKKTTGAKS